MLATGDCTGPATRRAPELDGILGRPLPAARPRDERDLQDLAQEISAFRPAWSAVQQLLVFDTGGYARTALFRDSDWEVALLCWLPGQATAIHGHGASQGLARVLVGELEETRYRPRGDSLLVEDGSHRLAPPRMILLDRPGTVHRVRNPGNRVAISLHVYSPPIELMEDLGPIVAT